MFVYVGVVAKCLNDFSIFNLKSGKSENLEFERKTYPNVVHCLRSYTAPKSLLGPFEEPAKIESDWAGNMKIWLLIEILVFFSYSLTLIVLLIKSRLMSVGVDQTQQFEPFYLAKLIKKIAYSIDYDFY